MWIYYHSFKTLKKDKRGSKVKDENWKEEAEVKGGGKINLELSFGVKMDRDMPRSPKLHLFVFNFWSQPSVLIDYI